jgi:vancomycin resistance protein YoaR
MKRDRHSVNPFKRAAIIALGLLILWAVGMTVIYNGRALPGVYVGSLSVAGKSQQDLTEQLKQKADSLKTLTFTYGGTKVTVPAEEVGLKIDTEATAKAAIEAGRSGGLAAVINPARLGFGHQDVPLQYELNREALHQKLADATKDIGSQAKDASIKRQGTDFTIVHEQSGEGINVDQAVRDARYQIGNLHGQVSLQLQSQSPKITASTLTPALAGAAEISAEPLEVKAGDKTFSVSPERLAAWTTFTRKDPSADQDILAQATLIPTVAAKLGVTPDEIPTVSNAKPTLAATINREAVGLYVPQLADEVDRPPVNARLNFADGKLSIVGESQDGLVVDRSTAVSELAKAAKNRVVAQVKVVAKPAEIRQETLPKLGINTLIGSATTTFAGSPVNRTYNIGVGASKFNGILIKPGEEFSFNDVLGDVGPETGYREELVIKENKTVPEYGGGLCQVSTTMFRAAMAAGLPITARSNHAYAVHYYAPIGMDATIYPPYPDMKFVNNTKGYILVQTSQVGTSLTYQFFGTDDGRKAHTEIMSIAATEENGGTASFRYVVDGGPKPINQVFTSVYKPQKDFPQPGQRSLN